MFVNHLFVLNFLLNLVICKSFSRHLSTKTQVKSVDFPYFSSRPYALSPLHALEGTEKGSLDNNNVNQITFSERIKTIFRGKGINKETLAKLGLSALLSYGWVSNFSYVTSVIIAWCIFGKATGLSPLAPGQWKRSVAIGVTVFLINFCGTIAYLVGGLVVATSIAKIPLLP